MEKRTVTVTEAGEVLGIGKSAAYEGVKCGQIPSIRIGGRILVPTRALEELVGLEPGTLLEAKAPKGESPATPWETETPKSDVSNDRRS